MSLSSIRLGAIILVLLVASSCAYITGKYEYATELQRRLSHAGELEDSKGYAEAAREYAKIAESYPDSFWHKKAVRKAAMLHVHPGNPQPDLEASLRWHRTLSALPISQTEMERIRLRIALLEQIRSLQDEARDRIALLEQIRSVQNEAQERIRNLQDDARELRAATGRKTRELAERDGQIQRLESEISRIQEELEKMKEVDLQLHRNRSED
jgi:DNA repair exonuclease SbcCD ATPase subunit